MSVPTVPEGNPIPAPEIPDPLVPGAPSSGDDERAKNVEKENDYRVNGVAEAFCHIGEEIPEELEKNVPLVKEVSGKLIGILTGKKDESDIFKERKNLRVFYNAIGYHAARVFALSKENLEEIKGPIEGDHPTEHLQFGIAAEERLSELFVNRSNEFKSPNESDGVEITEAEMTVLNLMGIPYEMIRFGEKDSMTVNMGAIRRELDSIKQIYTDETSFENLKTVSIVVSLMHDIMEASSTREEHDINAAELVGKLGEVQELLKDVEFSFRNHLGEDYTISGQDLAVMLIATGSPMNTGVPPKEVTAEDIAKIQEKVPGFLEGMDPNETIALANAGFIRLQRSKTHACDWSALTSSSHLSAELLDPDVSNETIMEQLPHTFHLMALAAEGYCEVYTAAMNDPTRESATPFNSFYGQNPVAMMSGVDGFYGWTQSYMKPWDKLWEVTGNEKDNVLADRFSLERNAHKITEFTNLIDTFTSENDFRFNNHIHELLYLSVSMVHNQNIEEARNLLAANAAVWEMAWKVDAAIVKENMESLSPRILEALRREGFAIEYPSMISDEKQLVLPRYSRMAVRRMVAFVDDCEEFESPGVTGESGFALSGTERKSIKVVVGDNEWMLMLHATSEAHNLAQETEGFASMSKDQQWDFKLKLQAEREQVLTTRIESRASKIFERLRSEQAIEIERIRFYEEQSAFLSMLHDKATNLAYHEVFGEMFAEIYVWSTDAVVEAAFGPEAIITEPTARASGFTAKAILRHALENGKVIGGQENLTFPKRWDQLVSDALNEQAIEKYNLSEAASAGKTLREAIFEELELKELQMRGR